MKKALIALLLGASVSALAETGNNQFPLELEVVKVHDGDTISLHMDALPNPLSKVSVRIYGIDTPELGYRAKCDKERRLAEKARDYVKARIKPGEKLTLLNYEWDKYGGRILATVYSDGVNVGERMIAKGFAVPYFGEGQKNDWCK